MRHAFDPPHKQLKWYNVSPQILIFILILPAGWPCDGPRTTYTGGNIGNQTTKYAVFTSEGYVADEVMMFEVMPENPEFEPMEVTAYIEGTADIIILDENGEEIARIVS